MEPKLFGQRAISLFLGLLIELQRERAAIAAILCFRTRGYHAEHAIDR